MKTHAFALLLEFAGALDMLPARSASRSSISSAADPAAWAYWRASSIAMLY